MKRHQSTAIFISATEKENLEELKSLIYKHVLAIHTERYPYDSLLY